VLTASDTITLASKLTDTETDHLTVIDHLYTLDMVSETIPFTKFNPNLLPPQSAFTAYIILFIWDNCRLHVGQVNKPIIT